jgi:surface protein
MFNYCYELENINLKSFNTSNVQYMYAMFSSCTKVKKLDLSNFNTSKLTDSAHMFSSCNNLETIYVSNNFTTSLITSSDYMFANNTKLVGGAGTTFDSSHRDKEYARIDGGTSNPGYFTRK